MPFLDNNTIAILSAVNELARACGLRPCDFVAVAGTTDEGTTVLRVESPAANIRDFNKMLDLLGIESAQGAAPTLAGSDETVYGRLEEALATAQRLKRGRSP